VRDHQHPPLPSGCTRRSRCRSRRSSTSSSRSSTGTSAWTGTRARFDGRFSGARASPSPHYTNLPRYHGAARADPRQLSRRQAPLHGAGPDQGASSRIGSTQPAAGYERREMTEALLPRPDSAYIQRSMYWMQLQPYLELFDRDRIELISQEELQAEPRGARCGAPSRYPRGRRGLHPTSSFDREMGEVECQAGRQVPGDGAG